MLEKAHDDKKTADLMIEELSEKQNKTALETAYLGSAEMLMAKHSFFPLSKWNHFKKGVRFLDQAVLENEWHAGIRFLRFACQTKSPDFLGYKTGIAEDKELIIRDVKNLPPGESKKHVIDFLLASKYLTESEKKEIQNP